VIRARRYEIVDEYAEDGRTAVYTRDGLVVLLSELASLAWSALGEDWMTVDAVAEVLVAEFGSPPAGGSVSESTEAALRALADRGLVELDESGGVSPDTTA
jgi:hypothetical protein